MYPCIYKRIWLVMIFQMRQSQQKSVMTIKICSRKRFFGLTVITVNGQFIFFPPRGVLQAFLPWKFNMENKMHSENADTSTSLAFYLEMWLWPFVKFKKSDVIRCCLLYCTLVPGMYFYGFSTLRDMDNHLFILCDLWPSPAVTFSFCQDPLHLNN